MQSLSLDTITHLPAFAIADEVNRALDEHGQVIVTAPPGAGKSTCLPLTILRHLPSGRILMLEPRRLAARQVAERMAFLCGEKVGETVGYRIRYEKKVSSATRIEVLTEGVLTRMLMDDPTLDGVAAVIFDEVHERSLQSDLALALTRECRNLLRPDLALVLMSATIDAEQLSRSLDGAPVIASEGRLFPVDVRYLPEENEPARVLYKIYKETEGDMLVFLPGEKEICSIAERLTVGLSEQNDLHVFPLYGQLPFEEQRAAIAPSQDGERKIVLTTSIAETSLTIEGVRVVVDFGLCRRPVVQQDTGLSRLETVSVSQDMADQRAGRAGRVAAGVCYRLYTLASYQRMAAVRRPEIEDADLTDLLLAVAVWGETHPERLPWLTPPPAGHLEAARSLLKMLGAISADGLLTEKGKRMADFPCHPRLAAMFSIVATREEQQEAARLAAELEERSPEARRRATEQFLRLMRSQPLVAGQPSRSAGCLLASAYPERVGLWQGNGRYRLASGLDAYLEDGSPLQGKKYIVASQVNAGSGRIFEAVSIEEDEVKSMATEKHTIRWDGKTASIIARREWRVGVLQVAVAPLPITPALREEIFLRLAEQAPKDGASMFCWSDEVAALQERITFVATRHPELALPDVSREAVLLRAQEWLPVFGQQLELRKIPMESVVWSLLPFEAQQAVDRLAPTHLAVPTGSRIRLEYSAAQACPVLRVRLQECFGLLDTPTVDDGRCAVLMELLSPGFKPVQLTRDLRSFWQNTYFEVRKELRRRYPKHSWPDDPLATAPVRGVKR